MRLNESGSSLFGSEEIRRRVDNKVESESVNVCVELTCLVQEETVKTGFCQESVQAASLVVEEQEVVGGT